MNNEELKENINEEVFLVSTAKTIVNCNPDLIADLIDTNLDPVFDETILEKCPIMKIGYGILKTGNAIREKHMCKKTLTFIYQLNNNDLSDEDYLKYLEKLKNKDTKIYEELEFVLIIIDRYVEDKKNIILANLYYNFIKKFLSWEQFQELAMIVNNIFLYDLNELEIIYDKKNITMNEINNKVSFNRLKTQSLVMDIESSVRRLNGNIGIKYNRYDYEITELGNKLIKYGLFDCNGNKSL